MPHERHMMKHIDQEHIVIVAYPLRNCDAIIGCKAYGRVRRNLTENLFGRLNRDRVDFQPGKGDRSAEFVYQKKKRADATSYFRDLFTLRKEIEQGIERTDLGPINLL